MYDTILVPTDGSDAAEAAARHAIGIATRFDATLHALYVVDDRYNWMDSGTMPIIMDTLEDTGAEATNTLTTLGNEHDVPVTAVVDQGAPAHSICDYADEHGIDLIVMGSHGRTGLERALIGSVTEKTVRAANTPVLIVK